MPTLPPCIGEQGGRAVKIAFSDQLTVSRTEDPGVAIMNTTALERIEADISQ